MSLFCHLEVVGSMVGKHLGNPTQPAGSCLPVLGHFVATYASITIYEKMTEVLWGRVYVANCHLHTHRLELFRVFSQSKGVSGITTFILYIFVIQFSNGQYKSIVLTMLTMIFWYEVILQNCVWPVIQCLKFSWTEVKGCAVCVFLPLYTCGVDVQQQPKTQEHTQTREGDCSWLESAPIRPGETLSSLSSGLMSSWSNQNQEQSLFRSQWPNHAEGQQLLIGQWPNHTVYLYFLCSFLQSDWSTFAHPGRESLALTAN